MYMYMCQGWASGTMALKGIDGALGDVANTGLFLLYSNIVGNGWTQYTISPLPPLAILLSYMHRLAVNSTNWKLGSNFSTTEITLSVCTRSCGSESRLLYACDCVRDLSWHRVNMYMYPTSLSKMTVCVSVATRALYQPTVSPRLWLNKRLDSNKL